MKTIELERVTPENAGKHIGGMIAYLMWKTATAPPQVAVALSREARKWYKIMGEVYPR